MTTQSAHVQQKPQLATNVSDWRGFVEKVYSEEGVERRTWARASRELPSMKHWNYSVFAGVGVSRQLRAGIGQLRPPDREYLESCARWSILRAEQGVPVDEAAEIFRLYRQELNRRAVGIAPGLSQAPKLMKLSELAAEWLDAGLIAVLRALPIRGKPGAVGLHSDATDLVRSLVFGSAPVGSGVLERHGINPSRRFYAVRARPTPETPPSELIAYLCGEGGGLAACLDGDIFGIVERLPHGTPPVPIGTSDEAVGLAWISGAFALAGRSHETQLVFGIDGQNSLSSLGLYPSVLSDNEVGDALLARYIKPFEQMGATGLSILQTVEVYLGADCALAETAKLSYLHVNSVRYRLRRFEEVTGRSLRATDTIAEVWWALARLNVVGGLSIPGEGPEIVKSGGVATESGLVDDTARHSAPPLIGDGAGDPETGCYGSRSSR